MREIAILIVIVWALMLLGSIMAAAFILMVEYIDKFIFRRLRNGRHTYR